MAIQTVLSCSSLFHLYLVSSLHINLADVREDICHIYTISNTFIVNKTYCTLINYHN